MSLLSTTAILFTLIRLYFCLKKYVSAFHDIPIIKIRGDMDDITMGDEFYMTDISTMYS